MATRDNRKFPDPCGADSVVVRGEDIAPNLAIFINNIQVYGAAVKSTPPAYIVRTLAKHGGIAYDRDAGEWFKYISVGMPDRYHYPKKIRVYMSDGRYSGDIPVSDRICIYPANALFFPPVKEITRRVATKSFISTALAQNINALKVANAILYDDETLAGNIDRAEKERLAGKSTVKIYLKEGQTLRTEAFSPAAASHILDLLEIWRNTNEELDAICGRVSLGEKNERRINEEISVIENAANATIDALVDTFNAHSDYYGIDAHAVRGSSLRRNEPPESGDIPTGNPAEEASGQNGN